MQLVDENRWYNFDDSHVAAIDEDEVKTAAAYVLFYRRVREQLVMDLSYMQREATDLAIDRLIHCADSVRGDFGNGTSTSFVGTSRRACLYCVREKARQVHSM
jgi:hypothetical protein